MTYIQVGVTAMRDPLTGDFLPAVPLYVRGEDAPKISMPESSAQGVLEQLAARFAEYQNACTAQA